MDGEIFRTALIEPVSAFEQQHTGAMLLKAGAIY